MNPFKRVLQGLTGQQMTTTNNKPRKRVIGAIDISTPEDRVKMEMKTLVDAVDAAIYPGRPDRRELIAIYRRSVTDPHVISQFDTSISKLVGEQFIVSRGEVDDMPTTTLFKKPWFEQYITACFDALMWGYTLVEFGEMKNGTWENVKVFPRRHVEPYSKKILIRPGDITGIYYGDKPEALYLLEIGQPENLGRLEVISREVIWKNFSRTDWSQASERFGMPLLYIKTATDNEPELNRIEDMARNFATNGYIISDIDDEVTILETAKSDIFNIYEKNARFCDEQISKCINGQTSTADQKAWTGAAQVHEGILEDFHAARLRHVSNLVNYSLFPFLQYHGFNLDGCSFRFPALDYKVAAAPDQATDQTPDQTADPTNDPDTPPKLKKPATGQGGAGTGKKQPSAYMKMPSWVIVMPEE